jgi:hypothetical protein
MVVLAALHLLHKGWRRVLREEIAEEREENVKSMHG